MWSKVENNQRKELRKVYEKEERKKLIAVLSKCPASGIGPYVD